MFDQNMLNELSKLKVDRKRKRVEQPEEIEYTVQDEDYQEQDFDDEEEIEELDIDHVEDNSSLTNLSNFIGDAIGKKELDPNKVIKEIDNDEDSDFINEDAEKKSIMISGRRTVKNYIDNEGNEVPSKYMDETGNLNVVYHEPGKNIVNRKTIEEQRLDVKMDALSGLLSKFKSDDEIKEEENDTSVIIMDKQSQPKKEIRRMDDIMQISDNVDMKISLVETAFKKLAREIELKAKLPKIDMDITSVDYLRALFSRRSLDDMDISRIFVLSLFLEDPERFPTDDTYEQVQYRNSQVGAKAKSIDLKRLITYISSDNEFNNTVELVSHITKKDNLDVSGVVDVFNFKCREALKTLMVTYLRNDSMDPLNRVNVISIKKDTQFKYRSLESTASFTNSLKTKLKAIHPSLKEQLKKTKEQIHESEEKFEEVKRSIQKLEKELTIMLILNIARQDNGYNLSFSENLPKEEIIQILQEYCIHIDSENVQDILNNGIKEDTINEILKSR